MKGSYKANLFFALSNPNEKKNFDSYSKDETDIYNFYKSKLSEISVSYRQPTIFELNTLRFSDNDLEKIDSLISDRRINNSFELYICSFIAFINKQYLTANCLFNKVFNLLKERNDIASQINIQFIKLQISQCYDLQGDNSSSLKNLLNIIKEYSRNHLLMLHADNLLASTYMRIGVYCERVYNNYGLAHYTTFRSFYLRDLFKEKYPPLVCEQYLATAYRLFAKTCPHDVDQYYWFSKSLQQRRFVLSRANDNFNRVELMFLLFDFCRFLILYRYKTALFKAKLRMLLKTFCEFEMKVRLEHALIASQYSLMITRYLISVRDAMFVKWLYVSGYFVQHIDDSQVIDSFLNLKKNTEKFFAEG